MEEPSIHEQSAAYALHALPENETLAFEEHLSACTVCMAELDSLRAAAAALAYPEEKEGRGTANVRKTSDLHESSLRQGR